MKNCPICNGEIKDTAKFCRHCGNKIEEKVQPKEIFCDECGAKLDIGSTFCEECGAQLDGIAVQDDPWVNVQTEINDNPWSDFSDFEMKEPEVVEKIITIEKIVEVEKVIESEEPKIDPTQAQKDFEEGKKLFDQKKYEKAAKFLLPKAQLGDEYAQDLAGYCYYEMEDYGPAFDLFYKAAEQGNEHALYILGVIYFKGHGIKINFETAFGYFKKASRLGYAPSYYYMGLCYLNGHGTDVCIDTAHEWLQKSKESGESLAQKQLDVIAKIKADHAEKTKQENYQKGLKFAEQAKYEQAIPLLLPIAEEGDAEAQFKLSCCYAYQKKEDMDKAWYWAGKAKDQRSGDACYHMGWWFANGNGVEKDYKKAVAVYEEGIEYGCGNCCLQIAHLYFNGNGVKKSEKKAVKYLEKGSNMGHGRSTNRLATCYSKGQGVRCNSDLAFKLYLKASEQGSPIGSFNVAECFKDGKGTRTSILQAKNYYKLAIDQTTSDEGGDDLIKRCRDALAKLGVKY